MVFLIAYVTAQFSAAGKSLSAQFDVTTTTGIIVGAALVALYAMLGGYRAVSWTDNVQAVMMALALIVLPITVVMATGGVEAVLTKLNSIDPKLISLTGGASGSGVFMAVLPWLMLGLAYPGQPHAVARLMSTRDQKVFVPAAAIAVAWFVVIYTGAVVLGMAARAGFADVGAITADPETALPILAVQFLPGALAGVTLAAIIAAICSTADSTVLSAATTVVRDLRAAFGLPPFAREVIWMRLALLVLTAIAATFALSETGLVFEVVLYAWTGLGASLGTTVLYCSLLSRPRWQAAIAGLLVGGTSAFSLHGHPLDLLLGFTASGVSIGIVHFVTDLFGRSAEKAK